MRTKNDAGEEGQAQERMSKTEDKYLSEEQEDEAQQNSCFVCGAENPHGMRLRFETTAAGESTAEWAPERFLEGFRGVIHGGIVSAALDEAMSKAVSASGWRAYTAELRIRLRHTVVPESRVRIRGWINGRTKRLIRTEAAITDSEGLELAHGWGSFLVVS
jgi:acyl-coenzyme A thioesterase PaaI-like protein